GVKAEVVHGAPADGVGAGVDDEVLGLPGDGAGGDRPVGHAGGPVEAGVVDVAGAIAGVVGDIVEPDVGHDDAGGDGDGESLDGSVGVHVLDRVLVVPSAVTEVGGFGGDDDEPVVGDED